MTPQPFTIFTVSDATGGLAYKLALSASRQFSEINVEIHRRGKITTQEEIQQVVQDAKGKHAIILFTMVSQEMRRLLLSEAAQVGVVAMDVMGPVLDMLSNYFHKLPSSEPGLQYRVTRDYYKRTEALEFTVRHDEGLGIESLDQADIVILGISRTAKTPLSIFLAYQGYRCANIPITTGQALPEKIKEIDPQKIIGLTIKPDFLKARRSSRLKNLGRPDSERYAQDEHIEQELAYALEVFKTLNGIHIVDVTDKALEEIVSEIIHDLGL